MCEYALHLICSRGKQDIGEWKIILSAFIDIQRAFETINRGGFFNKLAGYGVIAISLKWLTDFLSDRTRFNFRSSEMILNGWRSKIS